MLCWSVAPEHHALDHPRFSFEHTELSKRTGMIQEYTRSSNRCKALCLLSEVGVGHCLQERDHGKLGASSARLLGKESEGTIDTKEQALGNRSSRDSGHKVAIMGDYTKASSFGLMHSPFA